jgi:hypothetical protein
VWVLPRKNEFCLWFGQIQQRGVDQGIVDNAVSLLYQSSPFERDEFTITWACSYQVNFSSRVAHAGQIMGSSDSMQSAFNLRTTGAQR